MMRRIDNELQAMGQPASSTRRGPFIDGRDWGTLCALLNEDYHDLMNRNIVKTDSAAQLLFDRYDRAGVAGIAAAPRSSAGGRVREACGDPGKWPAPCSIAATRAIPSPLRTRPSSSSAPAVGRTALPCR